MRLKKQNGRHKDVGREFMEYTGYCEQLSMPRILRDKFGKEEKPHHTGWWVAF